jgi:hypothetical protein
LRQYLFEKVNGVTTSEGLIVELTDARVKIGDNGCQGDDYELQSLATAAPVLRI